MIDRKRLFEIFRYVVNGTIATGVHYAVFIVNLTYIMPQSAGISNFFASFVGIAVSFLGNRYFVFSSWHTPLVRQFIRFSSLYVAIAIVSGATLMVWSDMCGLNKSIGFLLAVIIQVSLSYIGGKRLVFA